MVRLKVVQVIKKLNNTELGKAGTNDTYVLIPQNLDISDLFPVVNEQISFINKENGDETLFEDIDNVPDFTKTNEQSLSNTV